ncbi:GalNAc-alpha-(1-_4)-GalNAc-alpha-(1-_3)-diNAcBac-PP-undecaprenol alpha-1,4-N-acetyl-D-galactosaminyltransferase [Idiomarina fontislapidosi]|uniref:Glycosyl transferase family 1 domain-containing protein n=1 Tax=Idiomarina fontislapidosi TaxID=263723 RepID=A0A432XGA3_9GAMM|nr:glycosyltransferase [Idiomarina fontislapidosi]PYE30107.1 GalNAc-alpha-(1->4)-GalNAc-alpha-(1->3)-diNAcBac-PP-undecaprenol alpha-1,4-N-acetyl-D-galactosaminyltransferase [Idiomarina fontislapidosi]RUO47597.1 hypothetical protein CWE25_13340 [Idiomarina fontislapidosi]
MKVIFIMPNLKAGGAERVVSELANFFASKDKFSEVSILTLFESSDFYTLNSNVKRFSLDISNEDYKLVKLINFTKARKYLSDVDVIVSFIYPFTILGTFLGFLSQKPVIISERNNPYIKKNFIETFLRRIVYPKARLIVCQTSDSKSVLEEKFRLKNCTIGKNPISRLKSPRIESNGIITVGRLIESKQHMILLNIIEELNLRHWRVTIVGDGPEKNRLSYKVKKLNSKGFNVKIVEQSKDLNQFSDNHSIFLFASRSEGFPNALAEALMAGYACIAFDCDTGPRDMIKDKVNGFLVPLNDIEEYKNRLELLVNEFNIRSKLGVEASSSMKSFDIDNIGEEWIDLINSVASY